MSKPDPIEQDFLLGWRQLPWGQDSWHRPLLALQRLVEGKPLDKTLKEGALRGKLKINFLSVAREAGRSRTLIALEDCRYPKVREAVKLAQGSKRAPPTTNTQLIEHLRADLATVNAEKRLLETKMAGHVLARRAAEIKSRKDLAEVVRLRELIGELVMAAQTAPETAGASIGGCWGVG